jgi:hypothetical protein
MILNGLVVILSVEDLGICNNERKDSFITLFCKEFGNDNTMFRMTAYGSTAEFIARNIITDNGNPYVGESGIAGYVQAHSKDDRKLNKVKIHGRRAMVSGDLDITYIKRDIQGVKTIVKNGQQVNLAMTICAEVPSTTVKCNSIQFIDKKVDNTGTIIDANADEIDYEALADSVIEGGTDVTSTVTGEGTNGSANFVVEGKEKTGGRERTSSLAGR